jgi:O-antigen ligase
MQRHIALINPIWLDKAGLFGTYLFATFALLGVSPATAGLILFTLGFLLHFRHWRELGRNPLALVCLVFAVFVAFHTAFHYWKSAAADLRADLLTAGLDWMKLLLFIPLAYWLRGDPRRSYQVLLLFLLGFVIATLRKIDWAGFGWQFFNTRFESYLPAIAFGMFAGLGALGVIATRGKFWGEKAKPHAHVLRIILWSLLMAFCIEGLVLSFSRGSWVAFLVAGAVLLFSTLFSSKRIARRQGKPIGLRLLLLLPVVALGILVAMNFDRISTRLDSENAVLNQLSHGDIQQIPYSSIGIRLHAWNFALEQWSLHPMFGLGAGSSQYMVRHFGPDGLKTYGAEGLPHLHNTYLEILFQFGLMGFTLSTAMLWLLVRSGGSACRNGKMPGDLCSFFLAALVFILIWNLFNYRVVHTDWRFAWIILAGCVYSFRMAQIAGARANTRAA